MKKDITHTILIGTIATTGIIVLVFIIVLIIRYMKASKPTEEMLRRFADKSIPRGYRNNNPLNIRISNAGWLGKVSPNTDGSFEQFSDIKYGYRAAIKTLRSYYYIHGLRTIRQIVNRWAPAGDGNDPTSYANNVAQRAGIPADQQITFDQDTITKIVYGMTISECGQSPYLSMADIQAGWLEARL